MSQRLTLANPKHRASTLSAEEGINTFRVKHPVTLIATADVALTDRFLGDVQKAISKQDNTPAAPPTSTSLQPLSSFITDLQPKYKVKSLSVLSSTIILAANATSSTSR